MICCVTYRDAELPPFGGSVLKIFGLMTGVKRRRQARNREARSRRREMERKYMERRDLKRRKNMRKATERREI